MPSAHATPQEPTGIWVPAAPFRLHLRRVVELTGLPWQVVSLACGVPLRTGARLMDRGRPHDRIRQVDAARLFAMDADQLRRTVVCQVSAESSQTAVRLLRRAGWSVTEIARRSGVRVQQVNLLADASVATCSLETALRLRVVRTAAAEAPVSSSRVSVTLSTRREAA